MYLIIFADYGLDDACATAYLLGERAAYEKIDIVPVGGNVETKRALKNARKLLTAAQADGLPIEGVRLVDTTALAQPACPLPSVHGNDGMGDLLPDGASPVPEIPYAQWVKTPKDYRVLSLGPLTVPVRTFTEAPALPQGETVIMGGCNRAEPNYNGYEFNDGLDHDAFVRALSYPHAAATLDTCRHPAFNMIDFVPQDDRLLGRLLARSVELAAARHNDRCYVYDYIAARALLHPDLFSVADVPQPSGVRMRELRFNG